jgi:hypothetical protein
VVVVVLLLQRAGVIMMGSFHMRILMLVSMLDRRMLMLML